MPAPMESPDARVLKAVRRLCARDQRPTTLEAIASFTGLDQEAALASVRRLSRDGVLCRRAEQTSGQRVCVYHLPGYDAGRGSIDGPSD